MKQGKIYTGSTVQGIINTLVENLNYTDHITVMLLEDVEIHKFDREVKVLKTVIRDKEVIQNNVTKVSVGWLCLLSKDFRKEFGIKE